MIDGYVVRTSRNAGFVTTDEQQRLQASTVAIAGAGGDGGQVAVILARMGVGRFRLADPEVFEPENLNRQAGSNVTTLGRNKADAVGDVIRRINPDATIATFPEGVTDACVDEFVDGADLVIDETEFTLPAIGVMIARSCRARGITVAMGLNVGFGCLVTTFTPEGISFERYLGVSETDRLSAIAEREVPLNRWVPRLPSYAHRRTLEAVQQGHISAPSVAPGVALAGGVLATEAFNSLTRRRRPVLAPRSIWVDALERRLRVIRLRRLSYATSALRLTVRSRYGLNGPG